MEGLEMKAVPQRLPAHPVHTAKELGSETSSTGGSNNRRGEKLQLSSAEAAILKDEAPV